ncbi:MAG: IS21-like element helper ATPase IstB [bacterium]|nr:IS21-like element helper ATPase IstB [bacterium]
MQIQEMAHILKLPYIKTNYQMLLDEANHTNMTYRELISRLLERELELRLENGLKHRLRRARFPLDKYLEDFDKSKYHKKFIPKFEELETLQFIENKENIILIGSPGCGKSHYSIGLGIKACLEGKSVLFISVPNLIIELKEAMSESKLSQYKTKFEKYNLVVLDELGYVSFDKIGCEILFNLLSNRNDKGSIIITTNLAFDRWEEIFKDPMLTGAIVDRLAHKSHILDISREVSHRFEETMSWLKPTK